MAKYRTAEQSRKPGYLAKQFARIRREQKASERTQQQISDATKAQIAERDASNEHERILKVRPLPVAR